MCTSEAKVTIGVSISHPPMSRINGRQVLQPTCNSVKKITILPLPTPCSNNNINKSVSTSPRISMPARNPSALDRKKSKSFKGTTDFDDNNNYELYGNISDCLSYSSSPGSIAAVTREQIALQRKMKIAHYGRSKSAKFDITIPTLEHKRCSFITPNSDPIYVAYHDQEWGVPVHDDKMLFELLVLSGAQVGSDWTSILKKRQEFREAFSWFEAETVSTFSDKHMVSISSQYAIEISRVRGVIDNSNRILQIKKELGSFEKYIWGFVNNKPISTQYKSGQRIPVKTSKSESISKDMVRRGFRFVGPTVVHSFMQAVGLTNDHLTTCHRHNQLSGP